jgi:hypothetical protein
MKGRLLLTGLAMFSMVLPTFSAEPRSATVTDLRGTVARGESKPPAPEQPAAVKDVLQQKDYLRTGRASLAELTFPSEALTRVGPLSVFRFSPDSANFILERGEGLFVFPKGKAGSTVTTPSFAAGILGTTVYVRADRRVIEYACLEGRCRIGPHVLSPGEKLVLRGSRIAYTAPKQRFDLARFLEENPLANDFANPLPSRALIEEESSRQE